MAYASYPSTTLTSHASINTKGAYTQIVAATPYASSRLHLQLRQAGQVSRPYLVDLALGAAGLESVIVPNILAYADTEFTFAAAVAIDVDVPAGSRLAARCQTSSGASVQVICALLVEDRALGSLATPISYGVDTVASRGTLIDPGATINTKGSYVELTASTSARTDAVAVCLTPSQITQAYTLFTSWQVDIATGAAAAETVVIPDLVVQAYTFADAVRPPIVRVPVSIAAGTRVAMRCQCDRNGAIERLLRATLIGMQEPATSGGGAAGAVAYVG